MASDLEIADLKQPIEVLSLYPKHNFTMQSFYETRINRDPTRPFIVFRNKTWTWAAFRDRILQTARMLAAKGIRKGDRVGVMATNSDGHILLLFALARLRAILVPVNPEFGVDEARYVLNHAGVSAVACSEETLNIATEACNVIKPALWFFMLGDRSDNVPGLDELLTGVPDIPLPDDVSSDDTCVIVYTSGTTGFPKGVMHSQRTFCLSGERHLERGYLQDDGRQFCVLPMFHINALFYSVASTVAAGASMVIAPRFSASEFWKLATETGATQVNLIMAASTILARRPRSEFVPNHRLQIVVGAPVTKEGAAVFMEEFGVKKMVEGFGMTEVPGAFGVPVIGPQTMGSMGKPGLHPDRSMKWTEARVVDDEGRNVPDEQEGELWIRIPTIMQGYYKDAEQTTAAFQDGWFKTGDLVRRGADGNYAFVARKKDIIRRRGENIAGLEIDRIIAAHPAVSEVGAIGVKADIGEEEVLVAIVPKPGASLTPEEIKIWCSERLVAFKVPRYVTFVDSLPHTPTHKVAKHILKKDSTLLERAVDLHAPQKA